MEGANPGERVPFPDTVCGDSLGIPPGWSPLVPPSVPSFFRAIDAYCHDRPYEWRQERGRSRHMCLRRHTRFRCCNPSGQRAVMTASELSSAELT